MTDKKLSACLQEMLDAATTIGEYIQGHNKGSFIANKMLHQAGALNVMQIGQQCSAAIDLDPAFTAAHDQINWLNLRRMRNQIAHDYAAINISSIWNVAKVEVSASAQALPALIIAAMQQEASARRP
jgi:uncharacterized protein with HEPN domain